MEERIVDLLVSQLGVDKRQVKPESTLADLGVDSLDAAEFVLALERTFNIEIPDTEVKDFDTVGKVVAYVEANAA